MEIWVKTSFGDNLFGEYEATWHPPTLVPGNFCPSPLIPGAVWVMSPNVFNWLEPRLKGMSIFAQYNVYQRDDRIDVLSDGVPTVIGYIVLELRSTKRLVADGERDLRKMQHVPSPEELEERALGMVNSLSASDFDTEMARRLTQAKILEYANKRPSWWKRLKHYFFQRTGPT